MGIGAGYTNGAGNGIVGGTSGFAQQGQRGILDDSVGGAGSGEEY